MKKCIKMVEMEEGDEEEESNFYEKKSHCLSFRSPFVSRYGPITILLDSNLAFLPSRRLRLTSRTQFPHSLRKAGTFRAPQWSFTRAIGEKPARLPTLSSVLAAATHKNLLQTCLLRKQSNKHSPIMGEKMFSISAVLWRQSTAD